MKIFKWKDEALFILGAIFCTLGLLLQARVTVGQFGEGLPPSFSLFFRAFTCRLSLLPAFISPHTILLWLLITRAIIILSSEYHRMFKLEGTSEVI